MTQHALYCMFKEFKMAMTPRRLTSSWLVWAMLGAWLAAADAPGPRPLTLREAAELALAHNPSVQAVRQVWPVRVLRWSMAAWALLATVTSARASVRRTRSHEPR